MNPAKGYYSLIQYCPDLSRLEAANVGIVLFCPEHGFIRALTDTSNARIRRFFGLESADKPRIDALKSAIERRFEVDAHRFKTLRDLQEFVATRANEIQLTEPRPMRVMDPEADLEQLFRQLVGEETQRQRAEAVARVREALSATFERERLESFLLRDIPVRVRALHRELIVPFGYRNGRLNLIQPGSFQQPSRRAMEDEACRYAVEGHSIYKNPDPSLFAVELQLVVVAHFPSGPEEREEIVRDILKDHDVGLYRLDRLDDLVAHIRSSTPICEWADRAGSTRPSTTTA